MKTVLTKMLTISCMVLLMLSSCKKNDVLVTSTGGTPGVLSANTTNLTLLKASLTDTTKVIKFSITQANYGFSAAITNTLQIDKPGDNFANPTSVTLGVNVLTQGYSTADFNNLLLKLGLVGGTTSTVQVRVAQSISTSITPIYSNIITLTATPFNLVSFLYVVGQFNGYSTTAPDSLISATGNGVYTGVINFPTGSNQFLILPAKNYNLKYATTNTSTPSTTFYSTASGGNNLFAPAVGGQYVITFNLNTSTITFGLSNLYSAIGTTVGDAGTYTKDIALTKYVNDGVTGWTGIVPFVAGNFKIRQNNDWTYSWGTIPTPDGVDLTDVSGGNIPVALAGNYLVSFNIALSIITSPVTPPPVTATYKLVKQ